MTKIKYRYQNDDTDLDQLSDESGIIFPDDDPTRQEFKDEVDVNNILARHGVLQLTNKMPIIGAEIDYSIDLQMGLEMVDSIQAAWQQLDPGIRQKYPSYQELLWAMERGDIKMAPEPLDNTKTDSNNTAPPTTEPTP